MKQTINYGLNKPESTDFYNIEHFNENADKIDAKLKEFEDSSKEYVHPNSGVTAGTYRSVTVNAQGHVTGGTNPTVTIAQGGTGATTAANALTNLGTAPVKISASAPTSGLWVVP